MTDEELDDLMAAVNETVLAELDKRIDVEAKLREVLTRCGYDPETIEQRMKS
jgi:hypothetical protein